MNVQQRLTVIEDGISRLERLLEQTNLTTTHRHAWRELVEVVRDLRLAVQALSRRDQ